MKYMMLIYGTEKRWTEAEHAECMTESLGLCNRLAAQGKFIDAAPLLPVSTATTVRVRDGRPLITDGPFAETVEQLGGFYVLELADLDEAIAVAAKLPPAAKGTVEIRPMLPLDGLPPDRPHSAEPGDSQYLLLIYQEPGVGCAGGPAAAKCTPEALAFARGLAADGAYISASPLHPPATATSVRVRDGKRLITDGPFAETTEVLGGYFLIRAASRAAAVDVAARLPLSRPGSVEVRQLFDLTPVRQKIAANP